ncbi:MAG TPA: glycosyltransferase family 2 protein [Myxococcota bacterium]|nr:glycosyltransferase family 2 protein [Myxococcota bacterium]
MLELLWITVGVGGIWLVIFVSSLLEMRSLPRVRPARGASHGPLPRVSVIIPARDEEANIIACLESLLSQDHADIEIIVVDDGSSDRTADLVARMSRQDYRVRLVRSGDLPAGWTGKCNAAYQGVVKGHPRGEWLLFTDADTLHESQSISAPLQVALDRNLDLVSLIPHLEARSFWECLMQPTMASLIAMFQKPRRVNDPGLPDIFANGQYILVRREVYDRAGGHAAVHGKVLEDVELARVICATGGRVFLAMGRDLFSTRMYTNLHSLIEGWAKNFYMILGSRLPRVVLAVSALFLLSLWPAVFGLTAAGSLLIGLRPLAQGYLWIALGVYALVLIFQIVLRHLNRWYPRYAPFAPLASLLAIYVLLHSARLHRTGSGVRWKGRVVFDDKEKAG